MGIFDDIKAKGAAYRLTEEALYAEALREIESGQRRDGIWAKAMVEADMDQGKAGAKYIKLRVQSLKDEVTILLADEMKAMEKHKILEVQQATILRIEEIQAQENQSKAYREQAAQIYREHAAERERSKSPPHRFIAGAAGGGVFGVLMVILFVLISGSPMQSTSSVFIFVGATALICGTVSAFA